MSWKSQIFNISRVNKKITSFKFNFNTSCVDKTSAIGLGIQIMPNTVVHCNCQVSDFTILNTSSTVDHECVIGKGVHIESASIAGRVKIGNYVTIRQM